MPPKAKHRPGLALIPPISLLEHTDRTSIQLMLPQLASNDQYAYVYRTHCKDLGQYVILDNGAAEGVGTSDHDLITMALDFGVSEFVIPDVIKDRLATQALLRNFRTSWAMRAEVNGALTDIKKMYVLQGDCWDDFVRSASWAADNVFVDVIGIPRHIISTCNDLEARIRLATLLSDASPKLIHLLGASVIHPTELREYNWPVNVRSTDTSMPFNYAYEAKKIRKGLMVYRPDEYFTLPAYRFHEPSLKYNITTMKVWTR